MARRTIITLIAFASGTIALAVFTELFGNSWMLLTDGGTGGYFIPAESSIFSFRQTQSNSGSGGWWIRGEDQTNFYAVEPEGPGYLVFPRDAVPGCPGFDPLNSVSWCSAVVKRGQQKKR